MGKSLHPIRNWSAYNRSLVERGNLTAWMDTSAIANCHKVEHHGGRGRGYGYSDRAIETALMLEAVSKLPLRATIHARPESVENVIWLSPTVAGRDGDVSR